MVDEAAVIGLEVNWDNTKVQALGTHQPDQEALDVHGHQVAVVNEFVSLGALTHYRVYPVWSYLGNSVLCVSDHREKHIRLFRVPVRAERGFFWSPADSAAVTIARRRLLQQNNYKTLFTN